VLTLLLLSTNLWAAGTEGQVVYLEGDVTVNGVAVDIGTKLPGQSLIRTGKGSSVEVVFGDRNIFHLGAQTVLKIDFSTAAKQVSLDKGLFTSVLKKLAVLTGSNPTFVLRTPTTSAGVRGTSFHVTVTDNSTYFCTCNGEVDLQADGSSGVIVLANAHHGSRVFTRGKDGKVSVVAGGLQDHTDATVEGLAKKIGVTIDWTKPDLSLHTP
jgi:ferric-dicitrate binding protein FerR (iron transport regulator)